MGLRSIPSHLDRLWLSERFDHLCDLFLCSLAEGVLLESSFARRERVGAVRSADESRQIDATDSTVEVSNFRLLLDAPALESSFFLPGYLNDRLTEPIGKEKEVTEQEHIRFDVEKTKRYGAVAS